MYLPADAEALLLPPEQPIASWYKDEYGVSFADIVRPYAELETADVGIVGIPFDTNTLQRRGSRFGPSAIRASLANSMTFEVGFGADLSSGIRLAEFGDIDVLQTDPRETEQRVERALTAVHETGAIPVVMGGDHSLSFPCVKALCNVVEGPVGVIAFDAHLDLRISLHGEINSGTPFRRILENIDGKPVEGHRLAQIGINGWFNSSGYWEYVQTAGIHVYPAREVHLRGIHEVLDEGLTAIGDEIEALYCTVDIDSLDASHAPGTNVPTPGGLSVFHILEAVYQVAQHAKIRAFDIMEVAPVLDPSGVTAHTAAAIVTTFIGGLSRRPSAQPATTGQSKTGGLATT